MNKKPTISSKSICTKKYYVNEMNQLDSYPHNPNQLEKNNHKNVIFRHSALLDILFQEKGQNSKIIQHGGMERGGEKLPFLLLTNDLFDFISGMEVRYYDKAKENGLSNPKVSILTLALSA